MDPLLTILAQYGPIGLFAWVFWQTNTRLVNAFETEVEECNKRYAWLLEEFMKFKDASK